MVSPTITPSPTAFHLVASFGRSAILLNEDSVGLILQSCLGGSAKNYNVLHLLGWMVSFSVTCKNVGIMIHKLKSFSCKSFAIFFYLWSGGGPNWQREYERWCHEQEAEWHLVGKKKKEKPTLSNPPVKKFASIEQKKFSYVDIVKSQRSSSQVFKRLLYPRNYQSNFSSDHDFIRFFGKEKFWVKKHNPRKEGPQESIKAPSPPLTSTNAVPVSNSEYVLGLEAPSGHVSSRFVSSSLAPSGPSAPAPNLSLGRVCSRCLAHDHLRKDCSGSITCKIYFNCGHTSVSCLFKACLRRVYRHVSKLEGEGSRQPPLSNKKTLTASPVCPSPPINSHQIATVTNPSSSSPVANFTVDPRPHVPKA